MNDYSEEEDYYDDYYDNYSSLREDYEYSSLEDALSKEIEEEEQFYKNATMWQIICRNEPRLHKRIIKFVHYHLEHYCSQYIGRTHMAMYKHQPNPHSTFEEHLFRFASWLEFKLRPYRK